MTRRGILSHKLRKFFRKANLASNASGAPNCPFHKSGKQGIWRALCKNLPLCSGFSGLLRLPPQSPNTQNSSAATPRPGADVRRSFSFKYYNKEVKNKNELVLIVLVNLKKYGKVKGIMIYLIRCSMYIACIACMICNSKQQFICYRNGGASDVVNIWNHCLDFSEYGGSLCCRR